MRTAIVALLLALAGCSPAASGAATATQGAPAVHPVSGLDVIPLTITTAKGRHRFQVEVARTWQAQVHGLMFRTEMGADEGMVFPFDRPRFASFWMRNTVIPLDMIFIGPDGRIVNIIANTVPYDETQRRSTGLVTAALELNGGRAAQLGIEPGDKVEW